MRKTARSISTYLGTYLGTAPIRCHACPVVCCFFFSHFFPTDLNYLLESWELLLLLRVPSDRLGSDYFPGASSSSSCNLLHNPPSPLPNVLLLSQYLPVPSYLVLCCPFTTRHHISSSRRGIPAQQPPLHGIGAESKVGRYVHTSPGHPADLACARAYP